jgi:ketosteroid isomerase-like protein
MPMELSDAIAGYVASANAHDAEACVRYFTEDAVVHDEGQEKRGHAAIRAWKEEVSRKYRPVVKALDVTRNNEKLIMTAAVSGDFKGSPIDLHFTFTLRGDKIARLDIAA